MNRLNRIAVVLKEKDISNKELADAIDKSEALISYYCTNDRQPTIPTLFKIARVLEVQPSELLREIKYYEIPTHQPT